MQYTTLGLHGTKCIPCFVVQPRVAVWPLESSLFLTIEHKLLSLFLTEKNTVRPILSAVFFKWLDSACTYGITATFLLLSGLGLPGTLPFNCLTRRWQRLQHRNRIAGISQPNNVLTEAALRQMVTRLVMADLRLVSAISFFYCLGSSPPSLSIFAVRA